MKASKRILITGITGFIGKSLYKQLSEHSYEVWGISRKKKIDRRIVLGDLLSYNSTLSALSQIPECQIVIHAAALPHSKEKDNRISYLKVNKTMTENIVRAIESKQSHFILLSSVAVYGEDGRNAPVRVADKLRPSTEYGLSKVMCEETLQNSRIKNYNILRLGPVFDDLNLKNIKKRVYFPFQSKLKLVIIPSPQYSFCHVNTLSRKIIKLLEEEKRERQTIMNVVDPYPYKQNQLLKQFNGIELLCPVKLTMPVYYLSFLFPHKKGYALRCFYWKLFKCNLYE